MTEIWAIVFGLSALLAVAVLLQPLSRALHLPHTVVLAMVGAGLAYLVQSMGINPLEGGHEAAEAAHGDGDHAPFWHQILASLVSFNITADAILFIFLPALVFESALSLDLRKLRQDLPAILFLAVIGVVLSAFIAGLTLSTYSGVALIVCLLIGAIVSATDPVAVIALFKDLGAPKRLTILVEGESLFNDATAIVFATIFLSLLSASGEASVTAATLDFLKVFIGGVLVGLTLGRVGIALMAPFRSQAISVVSLTLVLPFVTFVVAEHFLHVSGVMAAVVAGLSLGSYGRKIIPPQIFEEIEHSWHQIAFWATALIFILVGLAVPSLLGEDFTDYLDEAALLFVTATFARILIIFGGIPLVSRLGWVDHVSRAFQAIMVWGGLRGAVSLALALIVLDTESLSEETTHFVAVLVTFFVFVTLLFQATTVSVLMRWMGLDKLSPTDQAMRERSLTWARQSVHDELEQLATTQQSDKDRFNDILASYEQTEEQIHQSDEDIPIPTWVQTGLTLALGQERQFYLEAYGDAAISGTRLRQLISRVEETIEAVRLTNLEGDTDYSRLKVALSTFTQHTKEFERAQNWQRNLGWTGPLAGALTTRFGVMAATRTALHRQVEEGYEEITALLPAEAGEIFQQLHSYRVELVERAHKALWLQYPDFAAAIDRRNMLRAGFRMEAQAYDRLRDNGLIGPEVYGALTKSLSERSDKTTLPRLHLNYDVQELIGHVPLFRETTNDERRKIASKLRTMLTRPEETVLSAGDPGDSMYFIATGAVEILLPNAKPIELGTGQFFGEMSLITGEPRSADAISQGYSTLLMLRKNDFDNLMERNPKLAAKIRQVAAQRSRENVANR